ncbi:glycosyltransferase [Sphingomonas sp. Leaf339]|uniref:glycosyltransferase n=1 Tax=Sphingomonas sp. Leaf339 TaxID=1736343 RepID=UPI001F2E2DA0|nr:glycosyltransferase [Sphingomonas sp. Leaf339]
MQGAIDVIAREAMLFAGVGLLIGGIDDLLIDAAFLIRRAWRGGRRRLSVMTLSAPSHPGRMAVFVPAWDEEAVIGAMLTTALDRYRHSDYRIYVGLYPNDGPTIAAATAVARDDPRVRLVIGETPGPTTKAGCLNTLWHALLAADAADGCVTKAIVFHDAEDVVHPDELTVFDTLIEGRAVVQLPVLPLVKRGSRLVSGHYADEFAEAA